jgi:GNAT superfamily N-acetyltransferase
MEVRVVNIADCLHEALAFRNQNRPIQRDVGYFEWRYLRRPSPTPAFCVWLVGSNGPIGAATVAPHLYYCDNAAVRTGVVGDISIAQQARGRGIAVTLMDAVARTCSERLDGAFVLPNPPVIPALARAGWREVAAMPRYVRPTAGPTRNLSGRALLALALDGLTAIFRSRLPIEAVPDHSRTALLEALWRRVRTNGQRIGDCSSDYIDWRIRKHPIHRYTEWLVSSSDDRGAWAATRLESNSLLIDGLLADDEEIGAALLLRIAGWARIQAALTSIQVRATPAVAAIGGFSRLGFLRRGDLQPAYVAGSSDQRLLGGTPAWHLTAGDKDV